MRNAGDARDRLAAVVTQIDTRLAGTQAVIRDAGIYVDPENGKVTISAIDATNERIGEVSFTLDAVAAQIALKASVSYVDEAIPTAVLDPSQVPIFDDITARLNSAEVRLAGDRKRVVKGKSVSIRVDIVGRRTVTNKKQKN